MAEERRFPDDPQAADLIPVRQELDEGVGHVGEMGGRVDPARDGQPDELECGKDLPAGPGSFLANITPPISTARMPASR